MTNEPKYDEDIVNLGYLNKVIEDTEESISIEYENVSRHYGSQPVPPYYKGDVWIEGNTVYTCIQDRKIGTYQSSDWTTESGAKELASNKNKVFLAQPSNYRPGDMWILQTDSDHIAGKKGEMLISTFGRSTYNASDWINMLGYGKIISINEAINNLNNAINTIIENISAGTITVFYSNSVPENMITNDLWYVTGQVQGYEENKLYKYNGSSWVLVDNVYVLKAFEEVNEERLVSDGKIQSFYSNTEPTNNLGVGDLWIDLAHNNKLYRYNGTNWVEVYETNLVATEKDMEEITQRTTSIETDLGTIDLKVTQNTTAIEKITDTNNTKEGNLILIDDSAEEPIILLEADGHSEQDGTPTPSNSAEIHSIADDVNLFDLNSGNVADGYISASGYFVLESGNVDETVYIKCKPNTTYTVQKMVQNTASSNRFVIGTSIVAPTSNINVNILYRANEGSNVTSYTVTTDSNANYLLFFCYNTDSNTSFNDMLSSIKICEGSTVTPYSEYGKGTLTIEQNGINYFNKNFIATEIGAEKTALETGVRIISTETGTKKGVIFKLGGSELLGKTMTLSTKITCSSENTSCINLTYGSSLYSEQIFLAQLTGTGEKYVTFTIANSFPSNTNGIYIKIDSNNSGTGNIGDYVDYTEVMLVDGNEAKNYEEYLKTSYTIQTEPLRSLPNGTKDTIEEDGIHRRVDRGIIDGTKNWSLASEGNTTDGVSIYGTPFSNIKVSANKGLLCDYFEFLPRNELRNSSLNFITGGGGNTIVLNINNSYLSTLDVAGFKSWLNNNPIEVLYELEEEVVELFTEEQQDVIDSIETSLYTQYFSSEANMRITYLKNNGLMDMYETKQRSEKRYKNFSESMLRITQDEISSTVSEVYTTLENDYLKEDQVRDLNNSLLNDIDASYVKQTEFSQTNNDFNFRVTNIENNGVSKVNNTLVTIDEEGIKVSKNTEFQSLLSDTGVYFNSYGTNIASYTKDGAELHNLTVRNEAILGNLRVMKYDPGNGGEKRTHVHWIGG